jgi:GNAT superfamily N-acetyltransferase
MAVDRIEPQHPQKPGGTRVSDIGVVVDDDWQGRGVGSALMRALVTGAQARGVITLEMDVLAVNHQVLAMVTGHWPAACVDRTPDGLAIRVRLPRASPAAITPQLAFG